MIKCSQCNGTGYVQTSFGPKPCPTCHGTGYVDSEETSVSKKDNTMSIIEILFYSALAGVVAFLFSRPWAFPPYYYKISFT